MAPRAYSMGRRTEQVARTRAQIVDAAIVLYREQGIRATSMSEVARQADVAPGTVLHHFATPDELAAAALERIVAEMEVPTAAVFGIAATPRSRLARLVPAIFAFYERSTPWYEVYRRERDDVPALRRAEETFWVALRALYVEALGPLLEEPGLRPAILGLTDPGTLGALRSAGMTVEGAADLVTGLLLHLIDEPDAREPAG